MSVETQPGWGTRPDATYDDQLDIREYLRMFQRRWWLAAITVLLCVAAAMGVTIQQTKIYEARTRLFVGQQSISRQDLQFAAGLTQTSLALVKSYSEAIKSLPIAQEVVTKLGLRDDPQDVLRHMASAPIGETQIIRLTYSDPDPGKAAAITNALAESFITAIQRIDRQSSGEPAVQVSVLEPATVPDSPVSPKPVRNGAAALLLGAVLAWGVVLVAERLDSSVKSRQDAEEVAGIPCLSLVPNVKTPPNQMLMAKDGPAGEAFRMLRTAIRYMGAEEPFSVIAVTSPESDDGKTTTSFNLAAAFAESGQVTVLLEADLRKASLSRLLRIPIRQGLSSYLSGAAGLKGLVQRTAVENLYVVPAGVSPANPAELLGSERMGKLLRSLGKEADVIIIDTPPVLAVSDMVALTPMIDGVLLVARAGRTRKERLRETLRVLGGVGASVLGLVLNGVTESEGYYGYGYYSYRSGPTAEGPKVTEPGVKTRPFVALDQTPANGNGQGPKAKRPLRDQI